MSTITTSDGTEIFHKDWAILVGHSTGGGEVARDLGRHGTRRIAKAALVGAIPPLMLKTSANPGGLRLEVLPPAGAGPGQ